jgi:hypothetical protein
MSMTDRYIPKKNVVSPERLDAAAFELVEKLARSRVKAALAGGVAMQVYGSSRATGDVDLLVERVPPAVRGRRLTFGGVSTRASNSVTVALIARDDDLRPLYRTALRAARRLPGGRRVVTVPYLMAIKFAAGRPHDVDDLHWLILAHPEAIPRATAVFRRFLGPYPAARELPQEVLLARAKMRDPRRWVHL